jgi:formate-dependent phosphoribosylglycinamide formyltransferase (GAR transformylase)
MQSDGLASSGRPKALLFGSSFSAIPLLHSLKQLDIHVTICGHFKDDPCHRLGDASIFVNYANFDDLQRMVNFEAFDFLIPSCNDFAYNNASKLAERFHFPGYDSNKTTQILHNKASYRELLTSLSIPSPKFIRIRRNDLQQALSFPLPAIVKPVDSFSGIGIARIDNVTNVRKFIGEALAASSNSEVIVEEFIEGTLHSHSAFIANQRLVQEFFVDEYCTVYPYQVNCSNHPSRLSKKLRSDVGVAVSKIVTKLGLADGLIHTQFIVNRSGFFLIEVMRRCPGDLYGTLIEKSAGYNYYDNYVQTFILRAPELTRRSRRNIPWGRHTVSSKVRTIPLSLSHSFPSTELDFFPLKRSGDFLEAAPRDKMGIFFLRFASRSMLFRVAPFLHKFVR